MHSFELELCADPSTPQYLLPPHLRGGDNSREELCRRTALRLAMNTLDQKQRQALHLRYDLGMSFRSLAKELGISRTAAQNRVANSQQTLKALIELCVHVHRELASKETASADKS